MQRLLRYRSSLLLLAVTALSINALTGFAESGGATTTSTPVKVVTSIVFHAASGHSMTVEPGSGGAGSAACPPSYNYLISGGCVAPAGLLQVVSQSGSGLN